MNKLSGTISRIQQSEAILLVDVKVVDQTFSVLMIESVQRPDWLQEDHPINLVFKETEVSLAKNLSGTISTRNRMKCNILQIFRGELLTAVTLQYMDHELVSAITTRAADHLQLQIGDEVEALVKANEISLAKRQKEARTNIPGANSGCNIISP
jgi:molybdate transport system regulatory protein